MREVRMALSRPMVLARAAGAKTCTRRLVSRANSLVDGKRPAAKEWAALDWRAAETHLVVWQVLDGFGRPHLVTPLLAPGDVILWGEATRNGYDKGAWYVADNAPVNDAYGTRYPWLKPGTCEPYEVTSLSATYCPRAWVRYADRVARVTPSTPSDVCTPEEALAEGLYLAETEWGLLWTWRGHPATTSDEFLFDTPAAAYAALLTELHGSPVASDAPMWRVQFEPCEVQR